jgi:RNA polymerase sigma-70 factor, ECF subfamily
MPQYEGVREARGRRERFEALFRRHVGAVTAYAMRRIGPGAADDVVSETFLVAWRRLEDVPHDALPWLYSVARRALANAYRSRSRGEALTSRLADAVQAGLPASDVAEDVLERRIMRQAFDTLRPAERELLMLVAWDGLSNEHAAKSLEISVETFAVRLHRARKHLEEAAQRLESRSETDDQKEDRV